MPNWGLKKGPHHHYQQNDTKMLPVTATFYLNADRHYLVLPNSYCNHRNTFFRAVECVKVTFINANSMQKTEIQ